MNGFIKSTSDLMKSNFLMGTKKCEMHIDPVPAHRVSLEVSRKTLILVLEPTALAFWHGAGG